MRPEEYANIHLNEFLSYSGISEDEIHDARVELRKYLTIAKATYKLHLKAECIIRAKKIMRGLGKVRDMDIMFCVKLNDERDILARKIVASFFSLNNCYLPKIFGSRLVVAERIFSNYNRLKEEEEFHSIRKIIRETRFLVESLSLDSSVLKDISQELGNMRDNYLFNVKCLGRNEKLDKVRINELKEKALKDIEYKLNSTEFYHLHLNQ